jgi:hypothetical protein
MSNRGLSPVLSTTMTPIDRDNLAASCAVDTLLPEIREGEPSKPQEPVGFVHFDGSAGASLWPLFSTVSA